MLSVFAQERTISGKVTDAKTGLPLVACSVFSLRTGDGVITDEKGNYSFTVSFRTDSIAISMVGYINMVKPVTKDEEQVINFEAQISSDAMKDVIVAAKAKLSRAQRLIQRVIKNKQKNDVYNNKSFQCREYDKVEVDVKNIPQKLQHSILMKPLAFTLKHMDSTQDGQKFLPVYLSESTSDFYYTKNPSRERYDYDALKTSGIPNQSILTYIDGLYKRVNVYNDNIKLVNINFISPIADDALSFYNYHIIDTLFIDSHRCIEVQFSPSHYGSNAFGGYIWITDTSYAVKSIVMHLDKTANVNWINKFELTQNFEADSSGLFIPARNEVYVDLKLPAMKSFGGLARKTTVFKNVILNNDHIDTAFNKKIKDISLIKTNGSDTAYWNNNRLEPLSKSERFVYALVDTLQKIPIVVFYGKAISALTTGYYTAGKLDWGNIYNIYTANVVEGNRFNVGFKTNKYLTRNFQFKTYVGASTKDKLVRYSASTLFVLGRKPWSTLLLGYTDDIEASNQYNDEINQNSIFASVLTRVNDTLNRLVNNKGAFINYNKYFYNGFSFNISVSSNNLTPYFNIYYTNKSLGMTPFIVGQSSLADDYKTNELSGTVRYAYKEKYITQNYRRGSLGSIYPILSFTYTKGIKVNDGIFASDFNYDKYRLNIFQDFNDGRLGRLTYILQGGVTNGILPVLLLDVQKGNDTYYYDPYAFNNMNRYEFVADRYVSLHAQQNWGGFPFKLVPGLRKLKWRSLTTFNAVIGDMSEANKQANGYYDTTINYHFTVPNKVPYMEAGLGIANIFNVLRIDGVWRLTYRDNPDIPKFGLKASLELKF
jgi:hypothetical protein